MKDLPLRAVVVFVVRVVGFGVTFVFVPAMRKDLEQEIAELQRENERLQRERRQLLAQREEHTDRVRYVEDEISYREASLGTQMKWWAFGMD